MHFHKMICKSLHKNKEILLATVETKPLLLKRRLNYYVKKGELYHLRRGLYAKDKNYDKLELATKILTACYVGFETVLVKAGVIFQYYSNIFVTTYQTKEIIWDGQTYSFKKLKDTILTNNAGIEQRDYYSIASKERAFLDILYLNKGYHFDNLSHVDFNKIFGLLPIYNNQRMTQKVNAYSNDFKANRSNNARCSNSQKHSYSYFKGSMPPLAPLWVLKVVQQHTYFRDLIVFQYILIFTYSIRSNTRKFLSI